MNLVDPLLIGLSNLAKIPVKDGTFSMEMTFFVGGALVSGKVISEEDFYESNLVYSKTHEAIRELIPTLTPPEGERIAQGAEFIHLTEVQFYIGGQLPIPTTRDANAFRLRRDAVQGYMLGRFVATVASSEGTRSSE